MRRKLIPFFSVRDLKRKKPLLLFLIVFMLATISGANAQSHTITGRITDEQGKGLQGANVKIKGSTNGTTCDATGRYSINAPANAFLVISFTGFQEQMVPVKNQAIINVSLTPAINSLEGVIVTGYRTQTRGSVDGSVSSVNSKAFIDVPVDNISNALAGRLSGVTITQGSGTPGMQSDIRIRASGTYNNADPLYVIDGVVSDKFAFDGLTADQIQSYNCPPKFWHNYFNGDFMLSNREISRLFGLYAELLLIHNVDERLSALLSGTSYRIRNINEGVLQLNSREFSNFFLMNRPHWNAL